MAMRLCQNMQCFPAPFIFQEQSRVRCACQSRYPKFKYLGISSNCCRLYKMFTTSITRTKSPLLSFPGRITLRTAYNKITTRFCRFVATSQMIFSTTPTNLGNLQYNAIYVYHNSRLWQTLQNGQNEIEQYSDLPNKLHRM